MFTIKGLFSDIECPYKDTCLLPGCIFRHATTDMAKVEAGPSTTATTAETTGKGGSAKKQKVEKHPNAGSASGQHSSVRRTNGVSEKEGVVAKDSTPQTVRRRISPPPLRRSTDLESKPKVSLSQGAPQAPSKPPVKTPQSLQVPAKPQKRETLNPRLLKQAPAKHDLRLRLVKALHDQLVRLNSELKKDASAAEEPLVLSDQALITMTLDMEEKAATETGPIYANVVKNHIFGYKKMTVDKWKEERASARAAEEALKSLDASKPKSAETPITIDTRLTLDEELQLLPRLYTPITGLSKYNYVSSAPSAEDIEQSKRGIEAAKGWEVCDRCKTRFQVFPGRREEDGALTTGGTCKYHWGRTYLEDKSLDDRGAKRARRFKCCAQAMGDSVGCTQAETHVFKVSEVKRLAALWNFEKTPENPHGSKTPVAFDCEMGYTVHGLEMIRLTATSWPGGQELLDVLVRPMGEILDLNSRFSGVYGQQMADAKLWTPGVDSIDALKGGDNKELRVVSSPILARELLWSFLSPTTPLIGHAIENDLNVVRMIHPTIIDTALLFPHKMGLPYRMSLKNLMFLHLKRNIQMGTEDVAGHDSKEDAIAAGDLVRWKIGREWKTMQLDGWTLKDGHFIPPPKRGKLTVELLESGNLSPGGEEVEEDPTTIKSGVKRHLDAIS
jgi:RNA exonuclease 1